MRPSYPRAPTVTRLGKPATFDAVSWHRPIVAARNGIIARQVAVGSAVRYRVIGGKLVDLPTAQRIPMRVDTIFDVASITKLFTSILVLREVERGTVALDAPVARYLPEFAAN